MPIKEFKCTLLQSEEMRFEKRFVSYAEYVKAVADKTVVCPYCDRTEYVEPIVSQTARPQFQGSGFYETDYKGR